MKLFAKILQSMKTRKLPVPFRDRLPDVQRWRDCFGNDFELAERMLCVFCDAFMFAPEVRHKFRPEDTITAIYGAVYPSRWPPDSLEHTFLVQGLEKEFRIDFDDARFEKIESFQELVAEIRRAQSAGGNATSPRSSS